MPILTTCPTCSRQLNVPDELLGRRVKCPDCGTLFQAAGAGEAVPPIPVTVGGLAPTGLGGADVTPAARQARISHARGDVTGPAVSLIVLGILGILMALLFATLIVVIMSDPQSMEAWQKEMIQQEQKNRAQQNRPPMSPEEEAMMRNGITGVFGPVGLTASIVSAGFSFLIALGGMQMMRLRSRGLAMMGSILAMLPTCSPCCLFGLPLGIWAVTTLGRPEVREAFDWQASGGADVV